MYRFHPQTRAVLELIADGAVGEVQHVDASFSFRAGERTGRLFDPGHRRRRHPRRRRLPRLATPGRSSARRAVEPVLEPTAVTARGTLGPTGVDEWAVADLTFPGGVTASVRTGVKVADPTTVTVHGSRGTLHLSDPWTLGTEQRIVISTVDGERVARVQRRPAVRAGGRRAGPRRGGRRSGERDEPGRLARQRRRAGHAGASRSGCATRSRPTTATIPTVSGRPLQVRADAVMPYGKIDGLDLPGVPAGDGLRQPADPRPRLGDVRPLLRRRRQRLRHRLHLRRRAAGATARPLDRQPRRPRRRWRSSSRAPTPRTAIPTRSPPAHRVAGPAGHRLRRPLPDAPRQPRRSPVEEFVDVLDDRGPRRPDQAPSAAPTGRRPGSTRRTRTPSAPASTGSRC